jgi:hypothetical protein
MVFVKQLIFGFFVVRVFGNTFHRADFGTLRFIEMTDAFSAFIRINFVYFGAHINGFIGADRFANIAIDAFVSNF